MNLTSGDMRIGMIFSMNGSRFIYFKREATNAITYVLKCIATNGTWDIGEHTGHNIHSINNNFILECKNGMKVRPTE